MRASSRSPRLGFSADRRARAPSCARKGAAGKWALAPPFVRVRRFSFRSARRAHCGAVAELPVHRLLRRKLRGAQQVLPKRLAQMARDVQGRAQPSRVSSRGTPAAKDSLQYKWDKYDTFSALRRTPKAAGHAARLRRPALRISTWHPAAVLRPVGGISRWQPTAVLRPVGRISTSRTTWQPPATRPPSDEHLQARRHVLPADRTRRDGVPRRAASA